MKKHLLLGSALVAAISAFPQAASHRQRQTAIENMTERMAQKFVIMNGMEERSIPATSSQVIQQTEEPVMNLRASSTESVPAVNWNPFTGSMNMFGVLVSSSKPLQYDDELNAVTFVHRKSNSYVASPVPTSVGATTGVLVTMVSQNWGTSWDSTMIYSDNNNWARYPQGGILKANGTTNIANAYIVASAPITQAVTATGWIGDIITTKQLGTGTYNNIQAAASQTFIPDSPPYTAPWPTASGPSNNKVDFLRHDFTSTDDGKVRMMGQIFGGSANATSAAGQDFRGARIVTGQFLAGNMVFTADSLIPDNQQAVRTGVDGRLLSAVQGMAWSEDGQTGYAYFIGCSAKSTSVGANQGMQPIVYRSSDAGSSWALQPNIDFYQPAFQTAVLNHLPGTNADTTLAIPFFAHWEGIGAVVDSAKNLHLVSTIVHSPAADPDSSNYVSRFTNYDGEAYYFVHVPGIRPYLYDFQLSFNNPTWKVTVVDSLSSENPGTAPTDAGYGSNPWAVDDMNNKIDIDARIQASRTPDGKYVVYSWAETDTIGTTNGSGYTKWNIFPNVKARLMDVRAAAVSTTEINVSKLNGTSGVNPNVANSSYNHYISPKCGVNSALGTNTTIVINMPVTVSRTSTGPLDPAVPATHRYATAYLEFTRAVPTITDAIAQHKLNSVSNSVVYPNPASNNAFLSINLKNNSDVNIAVLNVVGQVVKTSKASGQTGANNINFDLTGIPKGIYMVNINIDNASSTKKLIVE